MHSFLHTALLVRYKLVYFFERLRGKDVEGASLLARCAAMRRIGRVVDARTQMLAKNICANC